MKKGESGKKRLWSTQMRILYKYGFGERGKVKYALKEERYAHGFLPTHEEELAYLAKRLAHILKNVPRLAYVCVLEESYRDTLVEDLQTIEERRVKAIRLSKDAHQV